VKNVYSEKMMWLTFSSVEAWVAREEIKT